MTQRKFAAEMHLVQPLMACPQGAEGQEKERLLSHLSQSWFTLMIDATANILDFIFRFNLPQS